MNDVDPKIPLKVGRFFDDHDRPDAAPVLIINNTLARQFYPSENAIGKPIIFGDRRLPPSTIVCIVGDAQNRDSLQ